MSTNLRVSTANLLAPIALKNQMPLRTDLAESIIAYRTTINNILTAQDPKKTQRKPENTGVDFQRNNSARI